MTKQEQIKSALPILQHFAETGEVPIMEASHGGSDWSSEAPKSIYGLTYALHDNGDSRLFRLKPSPVMVPLGPEDVPPGSVLRHLKDQPSVNWWSVVRVHKDGVTTGPSSSLLSATWEDLVDYWEILRPGSTEWQRCEKPKE